MNIKAALFTLVLTLLSGGGFQAASQEPPTAPEVFGEDPKKPEDRLRRIPDPEKRPLNADSKNVIRTEPDSTRFYRSQSRHRLLLNYSPVDTWIPSKWGISYAFSATERGCFEFEYLRGSVSVPFIIEDLGSITDQRISLFYRSYASRNSLSFLYGVNYSAIRAKLGNKFLSEVSGDPSRFDILSVRTLGVLWGLGNRWQFKNGAAVSIDWFSAYVPLVVLESEAAFLESNADSSLQRDVRDVLDTVQKIPTFAVFKLQLGISF